MLLAEFRQEFEQIEDNLAAALALVPPSRLYWRPFEHDSFLKVKTIGDLIIHICQIQEYLFNGLSADFWDHPHEWSSREAMPTGQQIAAYLAEVGEIRRRAFTFMNDADLTKLVYLPDRQATTIGELFLRALIHMSHHRGQVYAYLHLISDSRLPPISPRDSDFKRLI